MVVISYISFEKALLSHHIGGITTPFYDESSSKSSSGFTKSSILFKTEGFTHCETLSQ